MIHEGQGFTHVVAHIWSHSPLQEFCPCHQDAPTENYPTKQDKKRTKLHDPKDLYQLQHPSQSGSERLYLENVMQILQSGAVHFSWAKTLYKESGFLKWVWSRAMLVGVSGNCSLKMGISPHLGVFPYCITTWKQDKIWASISGQKFSQREFLNIGLPNMSQLLPQKGDGTARSRPGNLRFLHWNFVMWYPISHAHLFGSRQLNLSHHSYLGALIAGWVWFVYFYECL